MCISYVAVSISLLLVVSLIWWRSLVWLLRAENIQIVLDLLQLQREYEDIESASHQGTTRPEDARLCVVCLDADRTHMFRVCHHVCVCEPCSIVLRKCPMCQRDGTAVKVFF